MACSMVAVPARRISETRRSWKVSHARSTLPLACGVWARMSLMPSSSSALANRGVTPSPELLFQTLRSPGGVLEYAMPVAVQCHWDSVAIDDLPEHQHVAVGVLLLTEQSEGDRPGGVVHGADESQMWSATLQPVVPTPIYLQQHSLLGVALPSKVGLGARRRRGLPIPPAKRTRRTVERDRWMPSRSASISVKCEWLKPE